VTRCGALALTLALVVTLGCSASDSVQQLADDPTTSQAAPTAAEPDTKPGRPGETIDP